MSDNKTEIKTGDNNSCFGCGHAPAAESHECPYALEIGGSGEHCNCCEDCRYECAMDI